MDRWFGVPSTIETEKIKDLDEDGKAEYGVRTEWNKKLKRISDFQDWYNAQASISQVSSHPRWIFLLSCVLPLHH